jgi:DNA-binding protein Fis
VCADCILSKHKKHNFEPVEKILSEKLDDLKGAEARYSKDLTLCRAKVEKPLLFSVVHLEMAI